MTKVEFYFDPSCPFSWITSRWLLQVSGRRDIDITWRQFSLALKNNELTPKDDDSKYTKAHRAAHRIHRVIFLANQQTQTSVIDLYTEFGMRHHIMERAFDDDLIHEVLADKNLPTELIKAADDSSIDTDLRSEIDSAVQAVGEDIGVPTIVFIAKDGQRLGYFGPVLNELPDIDESLDIWDGLEKLATTTSFYEIKRNRPNDPDVFTTAKC